MGGAEALQYEENPDVPQEQQQKTEVLDGAALKGLSPREVDQISSKKRTIFEMRREAVGIQKQAKDLLQMATGKKRLTTAEAKKYEDQLKEAQSSPDNSRDILEKLQRKLAEVDKSRLTDATTVLDKNDPDLLKAYDKYDQLVDDNEEILGTNAAKEYKDWIRKQHPNLKVLQDLTVKFLQSERPPRVKIFERLTETLKQYGIEPSNVKYLKDEGLSERKEFLKNIEAGEKHFQKMGGMKEELYSKEAGQKLMGKLCQAENPKEQQQILDQLAILSREESQGYTVLKAGVQGKKMSQKSMKNITDYYKKLDSTDKRTENLKLWESFVKAEAKLTDNLRGVFDKEPQNKEGFEIAFRMFQDMDYTEKEGFIKKQEKDREQEKDKDTENKKLTVAGFKHAATQAKTKKTISASTEKNYHDWMENWSKDKNYKEVKTAFETLTSQQPHISKKDGKQFLNLKSFENERNEFTRNLQLLRTSSPLITDKEIADRQNEYDEKGWTPRKEMHDELKEEVKKAQKSGSPNNRKSHLKLLRNIRENEEGTEDDEESVEIQNKKTAIAAIEDLIELKAYGTAFKHCWKLLKANPEDEEINALMDYVMELADQGKISPDEAKESEIYEQYKDIAKKTISGDSEIAMETKEIQSQEAGLKLARQDQQKKQSLSAKDRNKRAVLDATKGDTVLTEMAEDYMEKAEDGKTLDAETLGGQDVIQVDFQRVRNTDQKTNLRRQIYTEQVKADKHGGQEYGSTVIDFKDIHTGRVLDAREGRGADLAQKKDKEDLSKRIAKKIAAATAITGNDEDTEHLKLAKEAALDEINKRAHTRIETMTKTA